MTLHTFKAEISDSKEKRKNERAVIICTYSLRAIPAGEKPEKRDTIVLKDEKAEMATTISEEFWQLVHEEDLSPLEAAKQLRKKYPLKKQKLPDEWIPDGGG